MTVLADTRPPGLDVLFRPGNALTVELTWPAGSLAGRTFTSTLGAASLSVGVAGDVMTITASAAQTAAVTAAAAWLLTETTSGASDDIIVGVWAPSDGPNAISSASLTVTSDSVAVDVSVVGGSGQEIAFAERVGNHAITGNAFLVFPIPDTTVVVPDVARPVYLVGKAILVPTSPDAAQTMELAIGVAGQANIPLNAVLDGGHGPALASGDQIWVWARLPASSPGSYQLYATVTAGDLTVLSPSHATAKLAAIAR